MTNKIIGVLAHVDAGKTTFSEQILCHAGVLRRAGRVDHGDAFLDAHPLERRRGITIFSDQAVFERDAARWFWVDTPGHADFAAEMERAVSVLDYAVVVISGPDGVQSHTEAIWALLERYGVPAFVFINKTDRAGCDPSGVLAEMKRLLSPDCVDMHGFCGGALPEALMEAVAERDEALLERLMEGDIDGGDWLGALRGQIARRELFPVYSGAALLDRGVSECLDALSLLTLGTEPDGGPFDALVTRVRHDAQGNRVCFFRVISGSVVVRESVMLPGGEQAKLNDLRLYTGERFAQIGRAERGMLCAAPGVHEVRPGDHIGTGAGRHNRFDSEPMLAASVTWDRSAVPASRVLQALRTLEEEDPALHVTVNAASDGIDIRVMGPIQLEVLRQLLQDRWALDVSFGRLRVVYQETIAAPAVGIGHYEPLKHYAEVQLRLSPGPRGSGITFASACHVDELALNWQRLIETHVFEKAHKGVLIGAPLTDVKVELLHGRAHLKHTEGGDFRQSTYRAIRNALMYAQSVLLEPVCRFSLRAPTDDYGRVMGDLTRMQARLDPPVMSDTRFALTGEAIFEAFSGYITEFMAATHGRGALQYRLDHYAPCRNAEAVIAAAGYDPLADDTPDSVFCAHGAGYNVPWHEVRAHAHTPPET
ncbi:MAG: TetM/TetW/TetO/TetS family tetracycline resistance ribosomal protection protein [Clostridia bacterium]|nr:TetM/TetW/TetO/TetS family tetracycline resistance ribosomal protection protein [Clostridia bacterium]